MLYFLAFSDDAGDKWPRGSHLSAIGSFTRPLQSLSTKVPGPRRARGRRNMWNAPGSLSHDYRNYWTGARIAELRVSIFLVLYWPKIDYLDVDISKKKRVDCVQTMQAMVNTLWWRNWWRKYEEWNFKYKQNGIRLFSIWQRGLIIRITYNQTTPINKKYSLRISPKSFASRNISQSVSVHYEEECLGW